MVRAPILARTLSLPRLDSWGRPSRSTLRPIERPREFRVSITVAESPVYITCPHTNFVLTCRSCRLDVAWDPPESIEA